MESKVSKIVVDEGVSPSMFKRFESYAKKKGIWSEDCLFMARAHPGMPDGQILHHHLNKTTVFVTKDRPFHNKVLSKGIRSVYVGEDSITAKKLAGIKPGPDMPINKKDLEIKESYHNDKTDIRPRLMPESPSHLKKLSTKRRRIRNHFGGQANLDQIAVTLSLETAAKAKTIIGIHIKVSSNVGIKAIRASESYIEEMADSEDLAIAALCHALIAVIRLMLNSVKTVIFFDAAKISMPGSQSTEKPLYTAFLKSLAECFENIEFVPTPKGKFVEELRSKLKALRNSNTNEIVPSNLPLIMEKLVRNSLLDPCCENTCNVKVSKSSCQP